MPQVLSPEHGSGRANTLPTCASRGWVRAVHRGVRAAASATPVLAIACAIGLAIGLATAASSALACDFEPVKKEIDTVLDHDKHKAERFRREVKDGYDSMKVLNDLLPPEWRDKLDQCRFFAAEYLAKRGFPPAH